MPSQALSPAAELQHHVTEVCPMVSTKNTAQFFPQASLAFLSFSFESFLLFFKKKSSPEDMFIDF